MWVKLEEKYGSAIAHGGEGEGAGDGDDVVWDRLTVSCSAAIVHERMGLGFRIRVRACLQAHR